MPHPILLGIFLGEANEIPVLMNDHQAPKKKLLLLLEKEKRRREGKRGTIYKANIRK